LFFADPHAHTEKRTSSSYYLQALHTDQDHFHVAQKFFRLLSCRLSHRIHPVSSLSLLPLLIGFSRAKSIDWKFNHLSDEESEEINPVERQAFFRVDRHLHQTPAFHQQLLTLLANEQNHFASENERLAAMARRAKAIVKGDPREFMG
jgi:hypothetical protein